MIVSLWKHSEYLGTTETAGVILECEAAATKIIDKAAKNDENVKKKLTHMLVEWLEQAATFHTQRFSEIN